MSFLGTGKHGTLRRVLPAGLLAIARVARADEPLPPAEPPPILESSGAEMLGDSLREGEAATSESASAAEPVSLVEDAEPGRHGRWRVAPHLDAKATFDDNIFIRPDNRTEDFIFTLAPGIAFGFWDSEKEKESYLERQEPASIIDPGGGNFWVVDYTAIFLGFAKTDSQNAVDHDALLRVAWRDARLSVGGSVHLESKSETNTEVGGRIRRKTLTAELATSYQLAEKTSFGFGVYHRTNDPEDFVQTIETRVESFLEYAVTPMVRLGFGGAVGRVNVESGADQTFERLLARASYSVSEKLAVEVRGGVEFRQSAGDVGDRTNPVFEVRTFWTPVAGTRIGLEAFRRVEASIERPEENFTYTGFALTVRRQLRAGWHGTLEGGYQVSDYTGRVGEGGREDGYWFVKPGMVYNFAQWGNAELAYEHRRNDSTRGASSFRDNQATVQVSFIY